MSQKLKLAFVGFVLGLGSPAGWLFIELFRHKEQGSFASVNCEFLTGGSLYLYLTFGTTFFFSIFGYFVGHLLEKITEKDKLYRKMVSFVAHELRTPLTSIKGRIDLALHQAYGGLNADLQDALQKAQLGCGKINELITGYLDLARIEKGEINPKFIPIDMIKDVILPMIEEFKNIFEKEEMTVEFKNFSLHQKAMVKGDIQWLKVALRNLLSNAVKYGYRGTVIEIRLSEGSSEWRFEIVNRGIGVPDLYRQKIFEKFERVPQEGKGVGTGLGLYIVKEVVEQHGGKIRCESQPGEWADFILTLPR